jgi:flavin-dependent dehydrogenase
MADVDVLVIGSRAAGLCAAIAARQAGASVLIAESEGEVGGSSRLSGGVVMGADTSVQRPGSPTTLIASTANTWPSISGKSSPASSGGSPMRAVRPSNG